jgi:hypothetical protein
MPRTVTGSTTFNTACVNTPVYGQFNKLVATRKGQGKIEITTTVEPSSISGRKKINVYQNGSPAHTFNVADKAGTSRNVIAKFLNQRANDLKSQGYNLVFSCTN